jgi:DNA-binding NarL/FixJ family response regulator
MATLTVLIASDVRFLRESLGDVLGRGGGVSVVGLCHDAAATLGMSRDLRPDIVLLDAASRDGLAVARQLVAAQTGARVIAFAVAETVDSVLGWAEAGVAGYIPSTASMTDLHAMIADIAAGRQASSGIVVSGLLRRIASGVARDSSPQAPPLTPREFEIVHLISSGLSNKEIARRLNIGLATTKSHVHNALGKLNLQRRGQAATWMHGHTRSA